MHISLSSGFPVVIKAKYVVYVKAVLDWVSLAGAPILLLVLAVLFSGMISIVHN